jgi:hypothetical protein
MNRWFIIIFVFCCSVGYTQATKYYKIQPGEPMQSVVPATDVYAYPQFEKGAVYFKNGVINSAKLNYNFLLEEMLFIHPLGDTLTLVNPDDIKLILIEKDTFYLADKRFVKIDTAFGNIKLANATFFAVVNKRRVGAYGTEMDAGSDPYALLMAPTNNRLGLVPQVVTTITVGRSLYIGNRFNEFQPVNRKNVLSFYPEKEDVLKKYIQTNKVDFFKRDDVLRLIDYMSKL